MVELYPEKMTGQFKRTALNQKYMRIITWNLQKKGLAPWSLQTFNPDFALFQEHWLKPNFNPKYFSWAVFSTESLRKKDSPCGTSIYAKDHTAVDVLRLTTTQKEFFIKARKTATAVRFIDFQTNKEFYLMSVHAYNGWPRHDVTKFALCIAEFLRALPHDKPALIAGDFNTFTKEHLDALNEEMVSQGFSRAISIPYDSKKTLDHVYVRGMQARLITSGHDASDHPYIVFEAEVL